VVDQIPLVTAVGFFVVLQLLGEDFEPATTVAAFLAGAAPAVLFLGLGLGGDAPRPEPRFDAPPGQPGSRRIGNVSAALRSAMSVGPLTTAELAGLGVVVAASIVASYLPVPAIAQWVAGVVVGAVAATEAALRSIPRRVRRALEAFGWLAEWELDRARWIGAEHATGSTVAAARWLAETPERAEDGWLRWEVLVFLDRHAEAAEVATRMPEATPYERFEKAYALDRTAWARGADGDLAGLRASSLAIGPETDADRRRAEVAIAVAESQQLASAGLDGVPPLDAARDVLPPDVRLGRRYVRHVRLAMLSVALVIGVGRPIVDALAAGLLGVIR